MWTRSDGRALPRAAHARPLLRNREDWWRWRECPSFLPLLDEVDESEDHDPDDVDEVPVQRRDVHQQGITRAEPAAVVDRQKRDEPQHARGDVCTVKTREREKGGAKKICSDREPFVDERRELEGLKSEEGRAGNRRHPQP